MHIEYADGTRKEVRWRPVGNVCPKTQRELEIERLANEAAWEEEQRKLETDARFLYGRASA